MATCLLSHLRLQHHCCLRRRWEARISYGHREDREVSLSLRSHTKGVDRLHTGMSSSASPACTRPLLLPSLHLSLWLPGSWLGVSQRPAFLVFPEPIGSLPVSGVLGGFAYTFCLFISSASPTYAALPSLDMHRETLALSVARLLLAQCSCLTLHGKMVKV